MRAKEGNWGKKVLQKREKNEARIQKKEKKRKKREKEKRERKKEIKKERMTEIKKKRKKVRKKVKKSLIARSCSYCHDIMKLLSVNAKHRDSAVYDGS